MAHDLVLLKTNEDGEPQQPFWHFVNEQGGSPSLLCTGEVFGQGEGSATFIEKTVIKAGITCPECLDHIMTIKKIKL